MKTISLALIDWFRKHQRDLPWRKSSDWYPVFLSEFLLQQTQVKQALPYFQKFYQRFPTIFDLARAEEDEVLQLWAGLGYYSRARNMLKAARTIVERFDGQFPADLKTALTLPGIGPYTASAILSIAFNKPLAVVDGNVMRVIARVFAIKEDLRLTATRKAIQQKSQELLLPEQPGLFNEAVMELGALICKPTAPLCQHCPIQSWCQAYRSHSVQNIPFRSAAPKKHRKFQLVVIVRHGNSLLLAKRHGKGMLAGMWEFPAFEMPTPSELKISNLDPFLSKMLPELQIRSYESLPLLKHIYSHIYLEYQPILLQSPTKIPFNFENYIQSEWFEVPALQKVAIHGAHKKILEHGQFKKWWAEQKGK